MVSPTIETVDVHLDRAHAALQYIDQGLRSPKIADQIKTIYDSEKIVLTYEGNTVILDAIWLKLIDYGLRCIDIVQTVFLSCLQRVLTTLQYVSNGNLLCERIQKGFSLDDANDHMPSRLKELVEYGLRYSLQTTKQENVIDKKPASSSFLVKSSVRLVDTALQQTRHDLPSVDMGLPKEIAIEVVASGVPTSCLQIDLFVSTAPIIPPHHCLSHVKIADVHLANKCFSNQFPHPEIDLLPFIPSVAGKEDSGGAIASAMDDQTRLILQHADAAPYSSLNATPDAYPIILGERDATRPCSRLPHYRWFHRVDETKQKSGERVRFQTTCKVRGHEDVSWEFWDKRRASRRWAGKRLAWFIYVVVRSATQLPSNPSNLDHATTHLPDFGGIFCVAG